MTKGRKPKPYEVKVAEGNPGKRELKSGAQLPAGPFVPPFPLDGIALVEWERIVDAAYWLRETESVAIADRCLCFQRLLEAEGDIRTRGMIVSGSDTQVPNPSIRIARAYRLSIQRYDSELGLTSSSRGRIGEDGAGSGLVPAGKRMPGDPLEEALCGKLPN